MHERALIAGTHSGCGKTTVTCALLAALKKRGLDIASFKCGPDYIDPMFHRQALGIPAHNLDPFFCTEAQLKGQLASDKPGLSVIEGVMGYYDGIGVEGRASTFDVARATETPVILVLNAKGMYASAGALLKGFAAFREGSGIRGVIFNNASAALYEGFKDIAQRAGVTPLGFLPFVASLGIESRHLGLVTAGEIANIAQKLDALGALAEKYIDIDGILRMAASAPGLTAPPCETASIGHVRIAVARDEAFCFLYQENLELLEALGAELAFFSPIHDVALPRNVQGLYLPGGYPELHAVSLSENKAMLAAVRQAVATGLPTIAECGGFLYLHDTLDGLPMVGAIHANAYRTSRLQRFGYVYLCAKRDNLLCREGENFPAHAFHVYDSTDIGEDFLLEKPYPKRKWSGIHATDTLYAGFPHLYFPARPAVAERFLEKAAGYAHHPAERRVRHG